MSAPEDHYEVADSTTDIENTFGEDFMSFGNSKSTLAIDQALAEAQSLFKVAELNKDNPYFESKYADLTSIWASCKEGLSKAKVFVSQWVVHSTDDRLHILTRLSFKGEWYMSEFSIPVGKKDCHGYASAATYAKRISLSAALGLSAEEDDDGNVNVEPPASKKKVSSKKTAGKKADPNKKVNQKQLNLLKVKMKENSLTYDDILNCTSVIFDKTNPSALL